MEKIMKILNTTEDEDLLPERQHSTDFGYDLKSAEKLMIRPNETKVVDTGMIVEPPSNHFVAIVSRSGLAAKKDIFVLNSPGIIDPSYCGPKDTLKVILSNKSHTTFSIEKGMRIAQMIVLPLVSVKLVSSRKEWMSSLNREGLGSTGT